MTRGSNDGAIDNLSSARGESSVMSPVRFVLGAFLATTLGLLATPSAEAAQLQQVSNWSGGTTFPSDVSMYVYVPDKVATNPPILLSRSLLRRNSLRGFWPGARGRHRQGRRQVRLHHGRPQQRQMLGRHLEPRPKRATAAATLMPSSRWSSTRPRQVQGEPGSRLFDGRLVRRHDDAALCSPLYPDVFKAGSAFAGVPAGCGERIRRVGPVRAVGSNRAAMGRSSARHVSGYSGHRPRVQLFHGDATRPSPTRTKPKPSRNGPTFSGWARPRRRRPLG